MTTTTCDICQGKFEPGVPSFNRFETEAYLPPETSPHHSRPRKFTFKIEVSNYKFDCTNFHVCQKCVLAAIYIAIGKTEKT